MILSSTIKYTLSLDCKAMYTNTQHNTHYVYTYFLSMLRRIFIHLIARALVISMRPNNYCEVYQ